MPNCFYNSQPFRTLTDSKSYINKQLKNLNGNKLAHHHKNIEALLRTPIFQTRRFEALASELSQLNDCIGGYSAYLLRQVTISQINHSRLTQLDTNREIIFIPANVSSGKSHFLLYKTLIDALEKLNFFEPLNLYTIASTDPLTRYRWIVGISLPIPVYVYKLKHKSVAFIWKIDTNEDIERKNLDIISQIDSNLPIFHTRAMKNKALALFKNTRTWSKEKITTLYNIITGGETADRQESMNTIEEKIIKGMEIEQIFDEEETECHMRQGKFENFWKSVDSLIDEHTTPHERRHGSLSYISPIAPSLRSLMDMSRQKMIELFPGDKNNAVPSFEWFRRQFTPRNIYTNIANTHTGRFNATFGLQQRLLRKSHPDQHYGAKQLCYFKEHASR